MNSLDLNTINELLKEPQTRTPSTKSGTGSKHKPIQLGPLRWFDETSRCASRGCSSPCLIKVSGVPYCTTHALYALNRICIDHDPLVDFNPNDCNCKAGMHSMMNIHTDDCNIYQHIKEQRERSSSTESAA